MKINFPSLTLTVVSLALFSLVVPTDVNAEDASPSIDGRTVMDRVKWRPDGDTRKSNVELTLIEKDGYSRNRRVSYFEKDIGKDRKTLLYVEEPADIRATAILIYSYDEFTNADDDIWLYLPARGKINILSSKNKQGRFVGSEYIFADIERLRLTDYHFENLGLTELGDRPVYEIEAIAASDRTTEKTGYTRRLIWVDAERYIILRDEFFDAQGIALKEMMVDTVEQISGFWVATEQTLVNLQSGRKTLLKIDQIVIDEEIPDLLFSKQTLRRGPR